MKLNQSGNILVSFTILLLIMGSLGYYLSMSNEVDKEIRNLSGTQQTSFMKSDFKETIRKTLMGTNSQCPSAVHSSLHTKFINFNTPTTDASYKYQRKNTNIKQDQNALCFFHPNRYSGVDLREIDLTFVRASEPNYISLSSFLTVNVRIAVHANNKVSQLKFSLRYRIDVLTMNHFGLISESSGNIFEIGSGSYVQVNSSTLLDQPARNQKIKLQRLMANNFEQVKYNRNFYIAAPGIRVDYDSIEFLKNHKLRDVFAFGIDFNALPRNSSFRAPYQMKLSTQWKDIFNYDVMDKVYPMPRLPSGTSAVSSPSIGIIYQYNKDKNNQLFNPEYVAKSSALIYEKLHGHKKYLNKSCAYSDLSTGQFNLFIFNNLNEDFTIDFSSNAEISDPPVFCGLIAARNLTFILNDKTSDELKNHHFIGKIIVKGSIRVVRKGTLHLNDIMDVTPDMIPYAIDDLSNVKTQYYNQKYFSAQNFNLPFFKNQSVYTSTNPEVQYYVPRDTKEFFNKTCGPHYCRQDEIGVPEEKKIITNYLNDLVFEVFNVE